MSFFQASSIPREIPYSSNMGYIRPNLTKMTSQFSWLLIGGEHLRKSSEIFGKIFGKRAASDWLLKIFRRDIDFPKMQKKSIKSSLG